MVLITEKRVGLGWGWGGVGVGLGWVSWWGCFSTDILRNTYFSIHDHKQTDITVGCPFILFLLQIISHNFPIETKKTCLPLPCISEHSSRQMLLVKLHNANVI